MSREEYYSRIVSTELRLSRERYHNAQMSLDTRSIENAVIESSNPDSPDTFAIKIPEQVIDLAYLEGVYLGDTDARETDISKLLLDLQKQYDSFKGKEEQTKESNLERFRNIAKDMYG